MRDVESGAASGTEMQQFDEYEEKLHELRDGLLTAYAAGFSKAVETFDVDVESETDYRSLKDHQYVSENHYYFWDGRTLPLEFWLREQFDLDQQDGGHDE